MARFVGRAGDYDEANALAGKNNQPILEEQGILHAPGDQTSFEEYVESAGLGSDGRVDVYVLD